MFKKLFADESDKTNLKLLLSAILTDISVDEFEDITFKETILPSNEKEGKICVLDLLVSTKSGMRINIEIQIVGGLVFITRMVYYNAKLVLSQLLSGDHYSKLKRSVSIFILDFELIDDGEYYHCFRFYDKANDRELTDLTEMVTIELPKVEALTDGTAIWSWAMLFKAKTGGVRDVKNES
jgi:predicted transposase/invertase (TIGR01784 family)